MDEKRLLDKLDRIDATLIRQEVNLARLTVSVEDHVKRSNLFEVALGRLQKQAARVQGAIGLISILGVLAAIIGLFLHR